MVYQHFTLVPSLTAAENLVISREDAPRIIDWRRERAALQAFMAQMPFQVPLDQPVEFDLSKGEDGLFTIVAVRGEGMASDAEMPKPMETAKDMPAAPPIIVISKGRDFKIIPIFPPAARYPPKTMTKITMIPIIPTM